MEISRSVLPSGAGIGLNLCRSLHDFVLPAVQAAIRPLSAQPKAAPAKEAWSAFNVGGRAWRGDFFVREARRPWRAPRPAFGSRAPFSALSRGGPRLPGPRHPRSAEVGSLREVFSRQPVGVLVRAALPRMTGLREVEVRSELGRHRRAPRELLAVVRRGRKHGKVRIAQARLQRSPDLVRRSAVRESEKRGLRGPARRRDDGASAIRADGRVRLLVARAGLLLGGRPSSSASFRVGADAGRGRRPPRGPRGHVGRSTRGPPSARPPYGGGRRPARGSSPVPASPPRDSTAPGPSCGASTRRPSGTSRRSRGPPSSSRTRRCGRSPGRPSSGADRDIPRSSDSTFR